MLAPGYGSASPTSDPTATIGVGHSANSLFAAATSALIVGVGRPAGNDPAATTSCLHFAAICGPGPIEVEQPDDAGRGTGEHDGGISVVLSEQQVPDEHRAFRRVDEARDRARVDRAAVSRFFSSIAARTGLSPLTAGPPSGMPSMPSVIAPTPPVAAPAGRPR